MRKKYIFGKKLYISVLTMIVVLLTTVATTFAWVGVFANSSFEQFEINIKASQLDEYGIEISPTGEEKTFSNYISSIEIKKQILINWGISPSALTKDDVIEDYFKGLEMDQCTTLPKIENNKIVSLGDFKDMYGIETTHYFKFDIYISAQKFYDTGSSSDFNLDVFLNEDVMTGKTKNRSLMNSYTYPNTFINPYDSLIQNNLITLPEGFRTLKAGDNIQNATLDSSTATRIAFEKYKVVDKYDTTAYTSQESSKSAIIFQKGYDYPVYDTVNDVYDFGGILPDEINLATSYVNSAEARYLEYNIKTISISDEMYQARGVESQTKDLIISKDNNQIIDSSNPNEKININQMMKLTIYFWFEGWDADCFRAIGGSPVTIDINLSAKND